MERAKVQHTSCMILIATIFFLSSTTNAQIGTITQDISTIAAYPLQKACAQSCFMDVGFCPRDVLGSAIDCAEAVNCNTRGWEAKNDCYCRQDLQSPARDFLTDCVQSKCTIGDNGIDAASAGSIYAQYCAEKGYPAPTVPANNPASATGGAATRTKGTAGGIGQPTGSAANPVSSENPTSSNKLPVIAYVGIAAGSLIAVVFIYFIIRKMYKAHEQRSVRKMAMAQQYTQYPHYQQAPTYQQPPVFPQQRYQEQFYPRPPESEVMPDDSISMVSAMPPPAHTLVSAAPPGRLQRH